MLYLLRNHNKYILIKLNCLNDPNKLLKFIIKLIIKFIIKRITMNTTYVLLAIYLLSVFMHVLGDRPVMHKRQLHGMFEDEKRTVQQNIINSEYENIYNGIIQKAKIGGTEIKFTLFCNIDMKKIAILDSINTEGSEIIKIYQLSTETLGYKIVDKLKTTFPDSHLVLKPDTNVNNPTKCLIYTLSW